jgi:hypothetical protein
LIAFRAAHSLPFDVRIRTVVIREPCWEKNEKLLTEGTVPTPVHLGSSILPNFNRNFIYRFAAAAAAGIMRTSNALTRCYCEAALSINAVAAPPPSNEERPDTKRRRTSKIRKIMVDTR